MQEFALGVPLSFSPIPSLLLRSRVPLKPARVWGAPKAPPEVSGTELSAENEFGALLSCEKPTGGNHFEYSEVHVLHLSLIRQYIVTASVRHPKPARPL